MKKDKIILLSTLISLIVIFVCFELQSWYHFGDIPTTVVNILQIGNLKNRFSIFFS